MEEEAHLYAVTDDGVGIALAASWRFHGSEDCHSLQVLGAEGTARLSPLSIFAEEDGRAVNVTPRLPIPRGGEDAYTSGYRRLLDHFVRVTAGEAPPDPPSEQAVLMDLIEGAYESAREGREVTLS